MNRSLFRNKLQFAITFIAASITCITVNASPQAPSPKPDAENVYRVGGGVTAPRVLSRADPEYSEEARAAKINGTVLLQVVVGKDGIAHHINVLKGLDGGLDIKAVEAVQKWKFEPGTLNGEPVDVRAQIEINFRTE
jgi:TonB family protein